jgi:lauroyl/myristoyl acyltransferase
MGPLCDGDVATVKREGIKAYQNVARYWVDLVSLPHRNMSRFEAEHLTIVHAERLAVLEAPGAIVAVSAHTGNAELAVQALTWRGRPYVALVEALQPPAVADYLYRLRAAPGGSFYHANIEGLKASSGHSAGEEWLG